MQGTVKVLAYSLTFGCFGAGVLLFGYLCSAPVFARQCCVTGRERTRALESMAVGRVSAPPRISHGTLGGGTESGLRCPLPPPHKLCGKGGNVGEEPGARWHVGGSPSVLAVAFLQAGYTWLVLPGFVLCRPKRSVGKQTTLQDSLLSLGTVFPLYQVQVSKHSHDTQD